MEAQAEPWEPSRLVYLDDGPSRSVQPGTAADMFGRLSSGGFGAILLWGAEHWYMRQERHDDRSWLDTLRPLFRSSDRGSDLAERAGKQVSRPSAPQSLPGGGTAPRSWPLAPG
jgi:hypothetical protein